MNGSTINNTSERPLQVSDALLRAGLRLSAHLRLGELKAPMLAHAASVTSAEFVEVFGDIDAFVHVVEQHLADELADALRTAVYSQSGRHKRLLTGVRTVLNLNLARRGAHAWVRELSRRSAPLAASRRKHERALARLLEPEFARESATMAQAEARLLLAALREVARTEGEQGSVSDDLRESVASFVSSCVAA